MPQAQANDTPPPAGPAGRPVVLPLAGRSMALVPVDAQRRDDDPPAEPPLADDRPAALQRAAVLSAGAVVRRYDWARERAYDEVLEITPQSVRLGRLQRGVPLLDSHRTYAGIDAVYGVVEAPEIRAGQLAGQITFTRRGDAAGVLQDVQDGVLRTVSVGYIRHRIQMEPPGADGGVWTYRVVDWEPYETSLVAIPADMDAQLGQRAAQGQDVPAGADTDTRTFPCDFVELMPGAAMRSAAAPLPRPPNQPTAGLQADPPQHRKDPAMPDHAQGGAAQAATPIATPDPAAQRAAAPVAAPPDSAADLLARTAEISELCARHGVPELAADLIRSGAHVEAARKAVLDKLALTDAAAGGHRNVRTLQDEGETRMQGLAEALAHRVDPSVQLSDNGRLYRGMSLLDMGREVLESHGQNTRGLTRMELAGRALTFRAGDSAVRNAGTMTTSDFPALLANVANKRLRRGYEENPGTYNRWARRAPNAPDFKAMSVVQLGAAPSLLAVNEAGEFKYGAMTDGRETYAVATYGRIVSFSRQAMVNDDLRGFDRLLTAFGASANRLENALVYQQLTANAALSDGVALFDAGHANVTTGVISAASLGAGRALMRKQTGLQDEVLNLTPSYLIVPAALEQKAYEFTSTNYVPATKAEINEFRAGGRTALEPIVEPILDASSAAIWYLAANAMQVDTVEYCWLDGAEGPIVEMEMGFDVDGVKFKCREDFAAKAIDHRGLVRSTGA